jgi:hypothetical protein
MGRDYAVEVANETSSDVGVAILIDGLDARTGEPTASCEGHALWILSANGIGIMRGFSLSKAQIATYRFTTRAQSLAALVENARPERIGTVEVCFFSTRPLPIGATSTRALEELIERPKPEKSETAPKSPKPGKTPLPPKPADKRLPPKTEKSRPGKAGKPETAKPET